MISGTSSKMYKVEEEEDDDGKRGTGRGAISCLTQKFTL